MASLLVIGGSGFFGKSILDAYSRGLLKPWDINLIYVIARRAKDLEVSNPELINKSIRLLNADICTCSELPFTDYVIHAAASTDAAKYINQPSVERENIEKGIENFCRLIRNFKQKNKILYVSSGAVYGKQPWYIDRIDEDYTDGNIEFLDTPKRDYAIAKRKAESAIQQLGAQGHSVCIARCFAFIGKYLPRNQHFAIGNFIQSVIDAKEIYVNSERVVIRSYMYADDLVEWLMELVSHADTKCIAYNVGSDEAISIKELAQIIGKKYNLPVKINKTIKGNKYIDRYVPSIKKAKNKTLLIKYKLVNAIDHTINQIFNNKN